jgi:hypothetical protein
MFNTTKPNVRSHVTAQAMDPEGQRSAWAGWRALFIRLRQILIQVFGRNHIAAEPANDAVMAPSERSPSVRCRRVAGRELAKGLAVTQGSRLVLVFEDGRSASAVGAAPQWKTEAHFVNLRRDHVLERRLGFAGAPASARRGQSRI